MAIKDRAVTIKGSDAQVAVLQIFPQRDGNCVILVGGSTTDSDGRSVSLKQAKMVYEPGQSDAMADLLALGLGALRKVNDLEDAPLAIEPVADVEKTLADIRAAAVPKTP